MINLYFKILIVRGFGIAIGQQNIGHHYIEGIPQYVLQSVA
jgi:hypothetical protein